MRNFLNLQSKETIICGQIFLDKKIEVNVDTSQTSILSNDQQIYLIWYLSILIKEHLASITSFFSEHTFGPKKPRW